MEKVPDPQQATLRAGTRYVQVRCLKNEENGEVRLSSELLHALGLPRGSECQLTIEGGILRLGPLIGVFVGRNYIRKLEKQHAWKRTMELVMANQKAKTILYFFSMYDVDEQKKSIRGTYFNSETGLWEKNYHFPYPDALYDRGSGNPRKLAVSQEIRERLESAASPQKLNAAHYFDKWEVNQHLSNFKNLRKHLPPTQLYMWSMGFPKKFRNYPKLYIKKRISCNGRKVMRIVQSPKGYQYSYYGNQLVQGKANSRKELASKVRDMFWGEEFIIQRAVDMLRVNRRLADFRATVQRNGQNEVEITAITARIAQGRSPITSTRTGSMCCNFSDFCNLFLDMTEDRYERMRQEVENFLLDVYEALKISYGSFAEVGIDFAMDKKGKLWFIECNAKLAKTALYQVADRGTVRKAFLNPLEYAKYITGFQVINEN